MSFEDLLSKLSKEAGSELREIVRKNSREDPEDKYIYPYEATVAALIFHKLLSNGLGLENMQVEVQYNEKRGHRYDMYYWDKVRGINYFIEVKRILKTKKDNMIYDTRDGLTGIREDLKRLDKLRKNNSDISVIMIVAYVGKEIKTIDKTLEDKWRKQIGEKNGITMIIC
ncbi:MAG: hypothetical protein M1431_00710 [Candidatus Thermoplasmatota archaeon]|nr:hypothetical protein [Candidatus Thermoplasmatota archaeon]